MKIFKYCFIFISLFLLTVSNLFSQTQLSNLNTTWTQVMGGKFISKPSLTPYGFIGATDGRTITSISNNGVVLWELNYPVSNQSIVSTISQDFTLAVTNGNKRITLINPSGVPLWNKFLDDEINAKAYEGRDGRFFLRSMNSLYCFGMNGICKWKVKTEPQSSLDIQELNDGSLIIFLKELNNGKTRALRYTPFGKPLEDITFAGEILTASTTNDGIFLTFTDGSAGLFTLDLKQDKAINKFVMKPDNYDKNSLNFFVSEKNMENGVFVTQKGKNTKLLFINTENGNIIWSSTLFDMNLKEIKETRLSDSGFFICDTKTAYFFDKDGTLLWNALLPENKNKTKWNHSLFTQNNTLVIFKDNWSMEAYLVNQTTGILKHDVKYDYYLDYLKVDSSVYSNIYQYSFNSDLISKERFKKLEAGFYGENEITYTNDILSACQAYMQNNKSSQFGAREELNVFQTNATELQSLLSQLPLYGTRYTTNLTAKLLNQETNTTLLNTLLQGIVIDGYDPDGEILKALEYLADKTNKKNTTIQMSICDATYSVCRFMGRPAYNKSGKIILKNFMYPANDSKVKIKARETMEKIGKLEK